MLSGEDAPLEHGAVIVATGASEHEPKEYLYGQDDRVMTQTRFEDFLAKAPPPALKKLKSVVMIQCVGSRDAEHPYCSRICCGTAIKNALRLKELNPKAHVYVLCRDVRVYGLNERWYRRAREKGVVFLRYDETAKPRVAVQDGRLTVQAKDSLLGRDLAIDADLVVLSVRRRAERGQPATLATAEGAAGRRRVLPGGARQAAARGFRHRGRVRLRPGALPEGHCGEHRPGAGGGVARGQPPEQIRDRGGRQSGRR